MSPTASPITTTSPRTLWTHTDPFEMAFTTFPGRVTAFDILSHNSNSNTTASRTHDIATAPHSLATSTPSKLVFPKVRIPLKSPSACTSTDSDLVHSDGALDDHASPSLLSYIFARQSSNTGSSSSRSPSHDMPLTPSLPIAGPCGRPILRKGDSRYASASNSEDGLSRSIHIPQGLSKFTTFHSGFNGLGLSTEKDETTDEGKERDSEEQLSAQMNKRRSCLTFAVRSPPSRPMSAGMCAPMMSPRSPCPRLPISNTLNRGVDTYRNTSTWVGQRSAPMMVGTLAKDGGAADEEEDEEAEADADADADADAAGDGYEYDQSECEDDGYEEDEEGGFTSDEDLTSAFTRQSNALATSSVSSFISSRPYTPYSAKQNAPYLPTGFNSSQYSRGEAIIPMSPSTSTSDDGHALASALGHVDRDRRGRGRRISIATAAAKCAERCTRHRSPPPTASRNLPGGSPAAECPPAARSPSALGMCRRRESASKQSVEAVVAKGQILIKGWKSDTPTQHPTPGVARARSQGSPTVKSAHDQQPCKSILKSCRPSTSPEMGWVERRVSVSVMEALQAGH